jgi:hypothetical protein
MAVVLLLLGGPAGAGMLIEEEYGLREEAQQGGSVVRGKVRALRRVGTSLTIELEATAVYSRSGGALAPGTRLVRRLYGGVEWNDPGESPVERRLRGALEGAAIRVGADVIMVGAEPPDWVSLLPASPAVLRRAAILFASDPAAKLAAEPSARLEGDVTDPDLQALALAELARRGPLAPALLLQLGDKQLAPRFAALSPEAQRDFLVAAAPRTASDAALLTRVVHAALPAAEPAAFPALGPLVTAWAAGKDPERRRLEAFRQRLIELAGRVPAPDLSPFVDLMIGWGLHRPEARERDEGLAALADRLDEPARARLAAAFLDGVFTSERARPFYDAFLVGEAVRLGRAAPAALAPVLMRLDPRRARDDAGQRAVLDALVTLSAALAQAQPAKKEEMRDLVDHWLGGKLDPSPAALAAYRAALGAPTPAVPRERRFTLKPGEERRLALAVRVSVEQNGPTVFFEVRRGPRAARWPIDAAHPVAGTLAPYVVKAELGPDGGVGVWLKPDPALK